MSKTFQSKTILKAIGEPRLALYSNSAKGYWYFVFDDTKRGIYESKSIYCVRLSDMALERWVEEGKSFCEETLAQAAARAEPGTFKMKLQREKKND